MEKAQASKELGNAAFKSGDFATAVGHYSAAIIADRNDITLPLNRAAAYLKLGKYVWADRHEDAVRDCTTVLKLSPSNVKALFRRAQAESGMSEYADADKDLKEALRLEPENEAIKLEAKKLAEVIGKGKQSMRSEADSPISAPASTKRRRIPIQIVEPESINSSSSRASTEASRLLVPTTGSDLLKPLSSRTLPPASPSQPAQATSNAFREAKQARETAKPSLVGGGIFRPSGNHTIFKPEQIRDPKPPASKAESQMKPSQGNQEETTVQSNLNESLPAKAPMSLFQFTVEWESSVSGEKRWQLIQSIPPSSLPSMFKTSLETSLLVSLLETFSVMLNREQQVNLIVVPRIREYMDALRKVARFGVIILLMSSTEKDLATEVLKRIDMPNSLWALQ